MMKATKGNKEYSIDESMQKFYQDGGFDIIGDDGEAVAYGRGKTVPYGEHIKAVKEIERMQLRIAELNEENEALRGKNVQEEASPIELASTELSEKKDKAGSKKAGE